MATARKSFEENQDPAAALTLGKYYAFNKNDWPNALPYFVKCADSAIKDAATLESGPRKTDAEALALADAWHGVVDSAMGHDKARFAEHCASLYQEVVPRLDGLAQLRAKKRLADLTEAANK